MNALVLYVGTQAIAYIQSKSGAPSISTITHSSHMDIFQNLAVDLDTEGSYINTLILHTLKSLISTRGGIAWGIPKTLRRELCLGVFKGF